MTRRGRLAPPALYQGLTRIARHLPALLTGHRPTRRGLLAASLHDPRLRRRRALDAATAVLRLTLENARLHEELHKTRDEVRVSHGRLVAAVDAERRRIQRDLHDGVQHRLLAISMMVQRSVNRPPGDRPDPRLADAAAQLVEVIRELRETAWGIYPAALAEQTLCVAVEELAERAPIPVTVSVPAVRWAEHVQQPAYFIIAEALSNTYKHANATRAGVKVEQRDRRLLIEVTDDGAGGADATKGSGLRGLDERVKALSGVLRLESPLARGTRVVVELPCA